jgi:hypothetical protein
VEINGYEGQANMRATVFTPEVLFAGCAAGIKHARAWGGGAARNNG